MEVNDSSHFIVHFHEDHFALSHFNHLMAGHNFKALSCTPLYLSLQFLHLSI